MRTPAKIAAWVLPWFLTGCWFHRNHKIPAPPVAPPIDMNISGMPPTQPPPPNVTIPTKPLAYETQLPYESAKQPPRRRGKPATPANPAETEQPPSGEVAVSAIGQLSTGDPAGARFQTERNLNDLERGLNGITRPLNDQEQATAAHIREFLRQAREALKSGDVDGATTLAAKVKVLLQELTH
jgi:hypothetical protein